LPPAMAEKIRRQYLQQGNLPALVLLRAADPSARVRALPADPKAKLPLDGVEMIDRDGEVTTLWFDAKSHILVRVGDPSGTAELEDWRDIGDGVRYPFKISIRGTQDAKLDVDAVKVNTGLRPQWFQ